MKSLLDEWKFVLKGKFILMMLIVPLLVSALFGYLFHNSQINEAPIAVVDEDNSLYSRQLTDKINASQYMNVADVFHDAVQPDVLMANEAYMAVIYLPRGMEQLRLQGKQVNIGVLIDNSMPAAVGNIRNGIQELFTIENTMMSMGKLKAMGVSEEAAAAILAPLSVQQRLLYNPTSDFIAFMVIGFVNVTALGITIGGAAAIVPRLRLEGKLAEELKRPIGLWMRILPYAISSSISLLLVFGVLKQVGGLRFAVNPLAFMVPLLLYTLVVTVIGMLVGWTAADPAKVTLRTYPIVYPSFMLSGFQVAAIMLPHPAQMLGNLLPLTWLFKFIRGMGYRGGSLNYYASEIGVLVLMLGVFSLGVGLMIIRENRKLKLTNNTNVNTEMKEITA